MQTLLGLGILLGGCSNLNETLSESGLSQEENIEVSATRDLKVTITVNEDERKASYDVETFVKKHWLWEISFQSQVLEPLIDKIAAGTNTKGSNLELGCSYAESDHKDDHIAWIDPDTYWTTVCSTREYFCTASGNGRSVDTSCQ